jgi:hypothetical protein
MAWKKLGLVFDITKHQIPWLKSHSMLPTPLLLDKVIRVFFTGRDLNGQSRISFVDLDRYNITDIKYIHDKPLLQIGKPGTFDDCGTVGTFVINNNDKIYMYYNGYNVRNTVPWSNSIGIAESIDNGLNFNKMFEGPIIDRCMNEPYFTITPCIVIENNVWHMWYTSGTGWIKIKDKLEPLYNIKYATSKDGISWLRENVTCVLGSNEEEVTARPTIIKDGSKYKMWFCYRGSQDFRDGVDSYRIGYAEASIDDPTKWIRDDSKAGITCGPESFDDKMQAYPSVIEADGRNLLFYNGNGFGVEGFCCAQWV